MSEFLKIYFLPLLCVCARMQVHVFMRVHACVPMCVRGCAQMSEDRFQEPALSSHCLTLGMRIGLSVSTQ